MKSFKKVIAVLLCAILVMTALPMVSVGAQVSTELKLNQAVDVSEFNEGVEFSFTPAESGLYEFYSTGDCDPYVNLFDSDGEFISGADDENDFNFDLRVYLNKGETYYFEVGTYDTYDFVVELIKLDCEKLECGMANEVTVTDKFATYYFTPQTSGFYNFYSLGDVDTWANLFDCSYQYLCGSDDGGDGHNFSLSVYLEAGERYFIEIDAYTENGSETFDVFVEEAEGPVSGEITSLPDDITCYSYDVVGTVSYDGLCIEYTLSDGSVVEWSYDEYGTVAGCHVYFDVWSSDDGYYVVITCGNVNLEYDLEVLELTMVDFEYVGDPFVFEENTNGYYEDDVYIYDFDLEGTQYEVTYTDGSSEIITYEEETAGLFDYWTNQYIDDPWTPEKLNYIYVYYCGIQTRIPVLIGECPIESVQVNSNPTYKYMFGDSDYGYMGEDQTYCLWDFDFEGMSLKVTYKDGTEEIYYDDEIDTYDYMIDGYAFYVEELYVTEPGVYDATMNYRGYDIVFQVEVVESPIKSIEYIGEPLVYEEYSNGYYDEFDGCFYYYCDLYDELFEVTYTDGTTEIVKYQDGIMGREFIYWSWIPEKDNYLYVKCFDKTITIPVVIEKSPVVSIKVNNNPTYKYVFGTPLYGYMEDDGMYCLWRFNLEGMSFTVTFNDGTEKTYNYSDIDEFENTIDGYNYYLNELYVDDIGVYTATMTYRNVDFEFEVELIEEPIESIEVIKDPLKTEYDTGFYPDFVGMQIQVNYKDGTTDIVTVTEENSWYMQVVEGDYVFEFYDYYDEFTDELVGVEIELSTVSTVYDNFTFNDSDSVVNVTIGDYTEDNFSIDEFKENLVGTILHIEYADGATEHLKIKDVDEYENMFADLAGWLRTDKGYIHIYCIKGIEPYYIVDIFGVSVKYYVGNNANDIGDVDGDGQVTVLDATAIQKYAAEIIPLDETQLECGDVDGDDVVTVLDAAQIQRLLAGLINKL